MNLPLPKYDLIIFGATSFVGKIICQYLMENYGPHDHLDGSPNESISWAIAGRSKQKLSALKNSLGPRATGLNIFTADATDEAALQALCAHGKVILSTVGPYALYGETLLKACVNSGTDYVDLTGEVHWIRAMLDKYELSAQESGARIVPCCGFDSIPSDLGVWFLQKHAQAKFGQTCTRIQGRIKAMKGGFSGGTAASIINILREVTRNTSLRKILGNPYALCLNGPQNSARQINIKTATYESNLKSWSAPFVMASINTRVVHRSNMLLEMDYGKRFQYDEAVLAGPGFKGLTKAQLITMGLGAFLAGASIPPSRWCLEKFVLPKPGEGPSLEAQANGFFDIRFFGTTESGETIVAKVTGDRDPGYGSTAKMISEAAICLAKDPIVQQKSGGFWTPATMLGEPLIQRLEQNAGLSFTIM